MFMKWKDEFSVKLITFDDRHGKMLRIINELHDAMMAHKGAEKTESTLKALIDYYKYHFSEEERLMTKFSFDGLAAHKAGHDGFIKSVLEMSERDSKRSGSVTIELMQFPKNRLKTIFAIPRENTANSSTTSG